MTTHKEDRLHLRVQSDHHALIEQAAGLEGLTLTAFATRHLVDAAEKIIERHHMTELNRAQSEAFLKALEAQEKPAGIERLQRHFGTVGLPVEPDLND